MKALRLPLVLLTLVLTMLPASGLADHDGT